MARASARLAQKKENEQKAKVKEGTFVPETKKQKVEAPKKGAAKSKTPVARKEKTVTVPTAKKNKSVKPSVKQVAQNKEQIVEEDDFRQGRKANVYEKTAQPTGKSANGVIECHKPWKVKKQGHYTIASMNVNGLRAILKAKDDPLKSFLKTESPDIFCIQETKTDGDKIEEALSSFEGYHIYYSCAEKKGYAGTAVFCKEKPLSVQYGIGHQELDGEGRAITVEFPEFFLISTYVPNSGEALRRLGHRMLWEDKFIEFCEKLEAKKPLIWTGDLNVAHKDIDIANPKTNHFSAGFTDDERQTFKRFLDRGYVDAFRMLYPDTQTFTYWGYRTGGRFKVPQIGWRLDYFVVAAPLKDCIVDCCVHADVMGSDHCPVSLILKL
eukprot:GCRY01000958.1.p1 GENE.GCRY01000958.1~~GCRY01000958.1.p1  ORF type:complete len:382 (-),score=67.82 GCRY01000958.1:43-1188(-)